MNGPVDRSTKWQVIIEELGGIYYGYYIIYTELVNNYTVFVTLIGTNLWEKNRLCHIILTDLVKKYKIFVT